MKPPAEKCAERIVDGIDCADLTTYRYTRNERLKVIAELIQSEYAETFKVAREAMELAEDTLSEFGAHKDETRTGTALRQLRTAMELMPK